MASTIATHPEVAPVVDLSPQPRTVPGSGSEVPGRERFSLGDTQTSLLPRLDPDNTVFIALSFEGPDGYSMAGGLGRRITELTAALAEQGYETHLYFIGDPNEPPVETYLHGKLNYHRWCTWISRHHPQGVYDGEEGKLADFRSSVPGAIIQQVIRPALSWGKRVIVLSEEWHTAATACDLSDALYYAGLRDQVLMLWNANNTMGFENIDFARLKFTHTLTTVSHWMKHVMWQYSCNPVVIPNGIPARMLVENPLVNELVERITSKLWHRVLLTKVARFDPDKRWLMAVEATAGLKRAGLPALLVARGGIEAHGLEVVDRARALGLRIHEAHADGADPRRAVAAILESCARADVVDVRFPLTEPVLRAFFHASDAVLANSGREPFGLVGLEVMASGGVAFTGATGEEYARAYENAIVLETDEPAEIEVAVAELLAQPKLAEHIRRQACLTAANCTWAHATENLLRRCQFLGLAQGWGARP
ncbi:MAG: glycosyltransferase family 4 protein [Armatimonadetes bacterium]|nr:glycosyltransferase family 4 protein [Armatimonadota bacterium]